MDKQDTNRWAGKSADYVLTKSFHEIRDPIYLMGGYLNILNSMELTTEEQKQYTELALKYALQAKEIVESVYQYINENYKDR